MAIQTEAGLSFYFKPKSDVGVADLNILVSCVSKLTKSVSRNVGVGSLKWNVTQLAFASANVGVAPELEIRDGRPASEAVFSGIGLIEHLAKMPAHFGTDDLKAARRLADLSVRGLLLIHDSRGNEIRVTPRLKDNVDEMLRARRRHQGSLIGRLEIISVHKGKNVTTIFGQQGEIVKCSFRDEHLPEIKQLLASRVLVVGEVYTNGSGDPVKLALEEIYSMPAASQLPSIDGLAGVIPMPGTSIEYLSALWGTARAS